MVAVSLAVLVDAFYTVERALENGLLLTAIILVSFVFKLGILYRISKNGTRAKSIKICRMLLVVVLCAALTEDLSWFLHALCHRHTPGANYRFISPFLRLAWAMVTVRYNALSLLVEFSVKRPQVLSLRNKILLILSGSSTLFFLSLIFFDAQCDAAIDRSLLEIVLVKLSPFYAYFVLTITNTACILGYARKHPLPRILTHQIRMLLGTLIVPMVIMDFLQSFPFDFCLTSIKSATNSYTVLGVSNILLTGIIFYCGRKLVGIRFLDLGDHVQSTSNFTFIKNFTEVIDNLGRAATMQELSLLARNLFQSAFDIPGRCVHIHTCAYGETSDTVSAIVNNSQFADNAKDSNILIYDEIALDHFCAESDESRRLVSFLNEINADIFIPLRSQKKTVGCIVVERNARPRILYGHTERAEMTVFAGYLGGIIYLLQNRNLEQILAREKLMADELYSRHQETKQYRESMRSFLRKSLNKNVGIVFYKGRNFSFGNREAQGLVTVNLNVHRGHPITQACRQIASHVMQDQLAHQCIVADDNGNKLSICGMPSLERNHVILTVHQADASDLIMRHLDHLKEPSDWDYLLYLKTTQSGSFINTLIPSDGEQVLNFKIGLLRAALSTKTVLLDVPPADLMDTVELLHHMSLRHTLYTLVLEGPSTDTDPALRLFGFNQLLDDRATYEEPILKKLDGNGTLFIKNINFLCRDAQDHLTELLRYGCFTTYRGTQRTFCDVRVICSSSQPLEALIRENRFSADLFKELQTTKLIFPSLATLTEQELGLLAQGFAHMAVADKTFEKILELSARDCKNIINLRPTSLQELRRYVQNIIIQKARGSNIGPEAIVDQAHSTNEPELVAIARIGKRALRDGKLMAFLWNKYRNQNKIATLLGVNRSSVSRRCKDYNLT